MSVYLRYKDEIYERGNRRHDLVELWKHGKFIKVVKKKDTRKVHMVVENDRKEENSL